MKKLVSIVLALCMLLTIGAAFADEAAALPTAEISITNMEKGDVVSLYKIIKWDTAAADWAFNGITVEGYDTVEALVTALNGSDASDAMTALAAAVGTAQLVEEKELTSTTYSKTVEVGSYLALVKGAEGTTYNPMVLSVNFTDPTTGAGSSINANTAVTGSTTVAKKQTVTIDKEVEGTDKKNDVAVGDDIPFIVTTNTPNYGENYTNPVFTITDTLSTGLTLDQTSIVVKNGETTLEKDTDYEITAISASGYTISFKADYLHAVKSNTAVTVQYTAKVNEKSVMHNVEQYDNDVDIVFSNSPSTTDDSLHDETHHYTFGIDVSLLGSEGGDDVTKELVKIGRDASTGEVITKWTTSDTTTWETISPLQGATFTLVGNGHTYNATSDANGYLSFTGLDAGEYTLTETSAPAGYKFSKTGIPVVISATYNADGTLNTYSIKVNNNATSTYTATNEGGWTSTTTINPEAETTGIINEEGVTLPHTGGIGTTIFYILGGLLVVGAAVILIARRKAEE